MSTKNSDSHCQQFTYKYCKMFCQEKAVEQEDKTYQPHDW